MEKNRTTDPSSGLSVQRINFEQNHKVPTGLSHILLLEEGAKVSEGRTRQALWDKRDEVTLELIGTGLCILYQAATCHRKCHGGGHVLESMCAKAYNVAAAAIQLARSGFYDEALNLIRTLGEIANLVAMSTVEEGAIQEWIKADEKTRWNNFRPAKVRARLKKANIQYPLIADSDWYSELSGKYTHISPRMKPNFFDEGRPICGGVFQPKGLNEVIERLGEIIIYLSLFICKFFQFDDLFKDACSVVKKLPPNSG